MVKMTLEVLARTQPTIITLLARWMPAQGEEKMFEHTALKVSA